LISILISCVFEKKKKENNEGRKKIKRILNHQIKSNNKIE